MATETKYAATLELIGDRGTLMTREFDAPRKLVFEAFSKPEHMKRWWGPAKYELEVVKMEFRPGGGYRYLSREAEGREEPFKGEYREIEAPGRLVYTMIYDVAPYDKAELVITMTLEERNGRTLMTSHTAFPSAEVRDGFIKSGMEEGMNEGNDRLEALVREMIWIGPEGEDTELLANRVFAAPRKLVFEAWSKPEHFSRWFAPAGLTLPVCEMDFRPGGILRFVMRAPDGAEHPGDGAYRAIAAPELIEWSSILPLPTGPIEVITRVTFTEAKGGTRVTVRQTYVKSANPPGAREGWTSSLDKLAKVLQAG